MNKLGKIFIALGALLIITSLFIIIINNHEDKTAEKNSSTILKSLKQDIIKPTIEEDKTNTTETKVVNQNNNYYLNLYLTDKELLKFNQKKIYIDDEMVNKKVIAISTDYILTELGKFRLVTLETTINEIDKISNNVIEIKVHERNTTIMKELIDKLIEVGYPIDAEKLLG